MVPQPSGDPEYQYRLIDDFRQLARDIRRRRRLHIARFWIGSLVLACLVVTIGWGGWVGYRSDWFRGNADSATLAVSSAQEQKPAQDFELQSADRMRDPILLAPDDGREGKNTKFELRFQNAGSATAVNGKVFYVSDRIANNSVQLISALPATPQDFALMNPAASAGEESIQDGQSSIVVTEAKGFDEQDGAGWDTSAKGGSVTHEEEPASSEASSLVGSSTLLIKPVEVRRAAANEIIVKISAQRTVEATLLEAALPSAEANRAAVAAARLLNLQMLQPGYVAALLIDHQQDEETLVQLTIIDNRGGVSLIRTTPDASYERVADGGANADLLRYIGETDRARSDSRRYRLMDGLYAAGIRSGVAPAVISEAIMQMARAYDLGDFMQPDDKFTLIYADKPRDDERDNGRVLYASIITGGRTLACYVLKPGLDRDFTCMTEKDTVRQKLGPVGFLTPVNGVLSSGFGPRLHPILGRVLNHNGVDWAAPTGTPIVAAFAGTVMFVGPNGGFGNFVKIKHANGLATGYAHMSAFASGLAVGKTVKAGETIGYVGTTGQSTGPHLHFELYMDDVAVDPLSFDGGTVAVNGSEKDKLIARIIGVESGGDPSAQNPLSSATGLGQFISGTWLRMIRSYRPDLMSSMSEGDILALRFNPTISRDMLYHLASENEADLRRAGQRATAGNLYLAHFLGSTGAISVLRAAPDQPLIDLVGYDVIAANPFLSGRDAQWVVDWAARKMSGASTILASRLPPETRIRNSRFAAYSSAIDSLLKSIAERRPTG